MAPDSLVHNDGFSEEEQRGLYRAIFSRRDIRNFKHHPIPPDVLARIVRAAHHGPVSYTHLTLPTICSV